MKWRIILLVFLTHLAGKADAQYRINGKYLPEPVMKLDTEEPVYGYAIYEEIPNEGKKFKLVIDYQYPEAYPFSEPSGLARVRVGDKYGFISTTNVWVIRPRFEEADDFDAKGFCRVLLDGKYGLINTKGDFVIPNKYDSMGNLLNGWYEVCQDDVWGYVHRTNIYVSSYDEYRKKCDAGLKDPE